MRWGDCRTGDLREGELPSQLDEKEFLVFMLADDSPDAGGIAKIGLVWSQRLRVAAQGRGLFASKVDAEQSQSFPEPIAKGKARDYPRCMAPWVRTAWAWAWTHPFSSGTLKERLGAAVWVVEPGNRQQTGALNCATQRPKPLGQRSGR